MSFELKLSRFLLDFKFVELGFVELSFVSIKVCEVTRFCRVGFGRPKCATRLDFVELSFVEFKFVELKYVELQVFSKLPPLFL